MFRLLKTESVVLKKKSLLNKDYLVTVFSETEGKVNAIAKGAKKITSRRLSHLQTGNLIEAIFNKKGEYFYLQETRLVSGFSKIKDSQKKQHFLYFFLFVVERLMAENQKDFSVYNLLKQFLIKLSESNNFNDQHLFQFMNELMRDLGYTKESKSPVELQQLIESIINEKLPAFII